MKRFNKTLAILCSATMILGSSLTAFAEAPTSTGGTGNVLAYDYDTIVVPTAIKVTFNPQGLAVRTGGTDDSPTTSTAQIVSLNYGIASKASTDKKVVVKFAANFVQSGEEEADVDFVATEAAATAEAAADDGGAKADEHKIYLYVAPASAAPTTSADAAFEASGDAGAKTDNATAENLADVKMTAATTAAVPFAAAASTPKNDAFANIGFKLTKATYSLKTAGSVDFDTTQDELAEKMEMSTLGQVTGFTIGGKMNTNTDWTKANISAINITPIYTVAAAGTEAAVASTAGVITLAAATDTAEPDKPAAGGSESAVKTGVAAVLSAGGKAYLALHGVADAAFTVNATRLVVNNVDVTAKAVLMNGYVGVSAADLQAAGVVVTGELVATYTVDGVNYTATYTPQ